MKRKIQDVLKMVDGAWMGSSEDLSRMCHGVVTDSRQVVPGNLFVPLQGERFDGCQFIPEALSRGAAACLYPKERPLQEEWMSGRPWPLILVQDPLIALQQMAARYRRELPVRVVAVTGSNGKTTTKDLVSAVLSQTFQVHKTKGNLNNHIGLPLTLLGLEEGTEVAVVEMGMNHPGEIALLSRLARPDIGIITNIGDAHLQNLGSREGIAAAKLEIIEGMDPTGVLLVNGDEPLLEKIPYPGSILRFGFRPENDLYPRKIEREGLLRTRFTTNRTRRQLTVPMIGRHMLINALAAVLCGLQFGLSEETIAQGLSSANLSGMRMEVQNGPNGMHILMDAYNASPTSMRAAFDLLREVDGFTAKVALLGDILELGEEEERLHRQLAEHLSPDWLDALLVYGPRARWIADEALRLGFPRSRVFQFSHPDTVVEALRKWTKPGTLLLVKASRGMRMEKIIEALRGDT